MKYCCKYDTVLVQGMAKKETKKTFGFTTLSLDNVGPVLEMLEKKS